MKISRKDTKKVVILLAVITLIIILFFFFNKSKDNKINADNKKNTISTEKLKKEALKKEELEKNNEKASSGDSKASSGKVAEKVTTVDNKATAQQAKDEIAKAISSEEGIAVFVKAANFGTTAQIVIDSSNFKSTYKYYQYFLANEPISKVESISNKQTTIFPAQKAGSEVVINLMSENKKVLKKLNIKLYDKK
ncbi:hypothetical protein G9F72_021475 [Clostridium estertheticum]|uniref:hypothetical protein n=1 Tax=Clostridium estertheticum TaxID=238834 RepID=UPI0013E90470|nr:hypothetical protein [Clostridium estertheticum]MBZ9688893.1 hypothetical protein [Clostridium estertheticum]